MSRILRTAVISASLFSVMIPIEAYAKKSEAEKVERRKHESETDTERKSYGKHGQDSESGNAEEKERNIKVNDRNRKIWEDNISIPDIIYKELPNPNTITYSTDRNEAPESSVPSDYDYAMVTDEGEVIVYDFETNSVITFEDVLDFRREHYYEIHDVVKVTKTSGVFNIASPWVYNNDLTIKWNARNTGCKSSSDIITISKPSICSESQFNKHTSMYLGRSYYRADAVGKAYACGSKSISAGPYTVTLAKDFGFAETTCLRYNPPSSSNNVDSPPRKYSYTLSYYPYSEKYERVGLTSGTKSAYYLFSYEQDNFYNNRNHRSYFNASESINVPSYRHSYASEYKSRGSSYTEFETIDLAGTELHPGILYRGASKDDFINCVNRKNADGTEQYSGSLLKRGNSATTSASGLVHSSMRDECSLGFAGYRGERDVYLIPSLAYVIGFDLTKDGSKLDALMPHIDNVKNHNLIEDLTIEGYQPESKKIISFLYDIYEKPKSVQEEEAEFYTGVK